MVELLFERAVGVQHLAGDRGACAIDARGIGALGQWRVAVDTPQWTAEDLAGKGAANNGARWNHPGEHVPTHQRQRLDQSHAS
jgi:hypothetical protein